ncbi:Probable protein phosphatase 2C 43 [Linum perenne]
MACWRPVARRYSRMSKDDSNRGGLGGGVVDALLWSRDLEKHSCGEFSFAVVQANEVIEDHSQVETGRDSVFVGVYDGHGGADASKFISDHLFKHFTRIGNERGTISEETLRNAFSATEDGFLTLVRRSYGIKPLMAAIGSCCLAGVICRGTLYVANLGDSRAVIGSLSRSKKIVAEQLTNDHNASMEEVRRELKSLHPDDSHIVVMKHGAWRIKGIIQGIARRLVEVALKKASRKSDLSYRELKQVAGGRRRSYHDDITVVVIFIDHELLLEQNTSVPQLSVRGFINTAAGPSNSN